MSDSHPTIICAHRWWASRIEVATAPVVHVCVEPAGVDVHPAGPGMVRRLHRCACGATLGGDGVGVGPGRAWTATAPLRRGARGPRVALPPLDSDA